MYSNKVVRAEGALAEATAEHAFVAADLNAQVTCATVLADVGE